MANENSNSWMPAQLEAALRSLRNAGTIGEFGDAFGDGMRVTPEDRRDMLWAIRDREGKSEPPRVTQTLTTQPSVDVMRQMKTIDPEGVGRFLPVTPYNDDVFIERANAGLNFGPNPSEVEGLGRRLNSVSDPEGLEKYKRSLRESSILKKAGYLGGSVASDVVNDSSRAIWWLINAPQAVTNLASEAGAAVSNPDLFARREVDLQEAVDKGWVTYKHPKLDEKLLAERVAEMTDAEETAIINRYLQEGDFDQPLSMKQIEEDTKKIKAEARRKAEAQLLDEAQNNVSNYRRARPGVKIRGGRILKNRFNPNLVNAATIVPAALAINAGIGLTGRREGYAATVPSDDDETQTSNVLAEVASRYLLGREGRLLDSEDFLLERPDVTNGEYQQYKNYLRDRDIDLNPLDDGKINLGGVLKTNPDGIRGAEVSFMGKSLPINDTIIPTVSAVLGTAAGAALTNLGSIRMRGGMKNRKGLNKLGAFVPEVLPRDKETGQRVYAAASDSKGLYPKDTAINRMQREFDKDDGWKHNARVLGTIAGMGLAGAAAGTTAGGALEDERRRRNFDQRNPHLDYDTYKQNSSDLLKRRREIAAANPNREQERKQSKVGSNKRNQQAGLQTYMLEQQTLLDQIVNEERKARAEKAMANQQWANSKFNEIEQSINENSSNQQNIGSLNF